MWNCGTLCNYVLCSLQMWLSSLVVPHGATSSLFSLPSASCLDCKACKQCLIYFAYLLCLHMSTSDVSALLNLSMLCTVSQTSVYDLLSLGIVRPRAAAKKSQREINPSLSLVSWLGRDAASACISDENYLITDFALLLH